MRMYSTRSRRKSGKLVWIAIGVVIAVVIIIIFAMRGEDETSTPDSDNVQGPAAGVTVVDSADGAENSGKPFVKPAPKVDPEAGKPAPGPKGMTRGLAAQIGPSPLTIERLSREDARKAYTEGIKLYAEQTDLLAARKKLNDAYNSGQLHEVNAGSAREVLSYLAAKTVLAPTPYVNPKDPYMVSYTFASGDRLGSYIPDGRIIRPGVVARNHLNVPVEIIPMVNGLKSATKFQAGRAYKLLKGPFHLVVYKDAKAADIYLQDLFIKRIPICIGAPETPTPEGFFRIVDRNRGAVYNAPSGSGLPSGTLAPNDPGYPLG
ncbi:MAG: L,D-transpeptidase, partial [Phycisphaerae bacterium]|nr:L,D-transpeptidase [Phycisphaerae bacterium]